uniref:Protein kinase domain-containing protein n=1 Tax=Marseillevirus LCMAC201 TaxID=2506605 RepID=A0A481YWF4_9VIRU|nr:MAG: hypothetical protein LCMAC201_04430 [Marseillevirus LCMAC201]
MEYYWSKQDLVSYTSEQIRILKQHFNIDASGDDLLWLLAVKIITASAQRVQMNGSGSGFAARSESLAEKNDQSTFNKILGAGGFGVIIKKEDSNIVGKFLIDPKDCNEAEIEYRKHLAAYEAFKYAQAKTNKYPQLCISRPLDFSNKSQIVMGKRYSCYYLMTELYSVDKNGLYHIVSQQETYQKLLNRVVGKHYDLPVSEENPSRGFFATYDYITENILQSSDNTLGVLLNISDLIRYIGYSFGVLLFIAELFPRDVEYVLGRDNNGMLCFTVLDFGMTKRIDFNTNDDMLATLANQIVGDLLDVDIYFPVTDELILIFKEGFTDAYHLAAPSSKKELVYQRVMEQWN